MACEGTELSSLPLLFGCPGTNEWILVGNAIGGSGDGRYARRKWGDIKNCITGTVRLPYIGVVDRGNPGDPVSDTGIFQNDSLIGLGSDNNGEIQMVIDETLYSNFGLNASFTYDPVSGTVDISPNKFTPQSGVFIDRNQ